MTDQDPNKGKIIDGIVENIIFLSDTDTYAVLSVKPENSTEAITVKGELKGVMPGEGLRLWGHWEHNKKYGMQLAVENYVTRVPASVAAIEKYLASGLIKGIGSVYAGRIVKFFGKETINIIDKEPRRLLEVEGIGRKRLDLITSTWKEQVRTRELMIFLQEHGISAAIGKRIYRFYGDKSLDILKANPFQLVIDIHGIGFKTADDIAHKLGIPKDSPKRIQAGVLHTLDEATTKGHTYLPELELKDSAARLLEVDEEKIDKAVGSLVGIHKIKKNELPSGEQAVFLSWLYTCERQVADAVRVIAKTGKFLPKIDVQSEIPAYEKEHKFTFAEEQKNALERALKGGVHVITGGPGTGKTTIMSALIHILEKYGVPVMLAAPTGRAANRLSETTGKPAATIHRLLKYNPRNDEFTYNNRNPLSASFIIVDEASMVDIWLAHKLLLAVPPPASVIFVGDIDQLPAVGPGNFLKDLIRSGIIPVVRFTEIFRQAQRSLIITNAHKINKGVFPVINVESKGKRTPDFFFIERKEPEEALSTIKMLVRERIPHRFKMDPVRDVQIITPMYKGVLGVSNLNHELQDALNPGQDIYVGGIRKFRIGDKVLQMRNNYDKDVFNGDIGFIETIDREYHLLKVRFGGRVLDYQSTELDQLTLAYAVSVHKSQGSEYKAVVMPVHTQHYIMLQRNLLYTAVTRAKRLVCVVGTKQAIALAVKNNKEQQRYSALVQWLGTGK
jgi:exodeoxyribonuclease V alpha subunit